LHETNVNAKHIKYYKYKTRAQREAARRCKSDWKHNLVERG